MSIRQMAKNGTTRRLALAAFVAAVAMTACGGSTGTLAPLPATNGPNATAPVPGTTAVSYASGTLAGATYIGPAQFAGMSIDVVPAMPNLAQLQAYASQVSDPTSALFRHFLTPQEIGDRFGASVADYQAQAAYFTSRGLSVSGWPQRMLLHVGGTQSQLENALGAKFGVYESAGQQFIALATNPQLPVALHVAAITHASQAEAAPQKPYAFAPALGTTSYLSPQQLAHAFDYDGAWAAGYTGTGITVGFLGWGSLDAQDIPYYGSLFGAKVAPITTVAVLNSTVFPTPAPTNCATPSAYLSCVYSYGLTSPPPVTASCSGSLPTCNPEDGESQLDTETVASLAYGANLRFYLAYNPTACYNTGGNYTQPGATCPPPTKYPQPFPELGVGYLVDPTIQQIIADDQADVVSASYQSCETGDVGLEFNASGQGFAPAEYAALAAEGIAVFASSGDDGASACYTNPPKEVVSYPASDPNVVGVGAVYAPLDQSGNLIGQVGAWSFPNTLGATCDDCAGSGGGVSRYFTMPPNQFGPGLTGSMRNVPDISEDGAGNSPIAVIQNVGLGGPTYTYGGGTSQAAPMAAAMWTLVLQACKATPACSTAPGPYPYRLGDPKAYLYAIYTGAAHGSISPLGGQTYASTFYDVLYGTNAVSGTKGTVPGYSAGVGYDNVTGIGVPYARELIKAVVGI